MISHKTVLLSIKMKKEYKLNPSQLPNAPKKQYCIGWDIQPLETEESLIDENSRMTGPQVDLGEDFIPF